MNHEIRGGFGPEFQSDVFARSLKPSEIEKEIFFPPGTEVFRDLVGLTGNGKPARSIVRRVGTEAIKRIIFLGPPGNGKTTVLNQCSRTLEANLGNSPISHYYDDKLTGDRSYDDTYQFNKNLFNSIKSGERLNPGRISLVELVGVGDIKVKDRGLTALNMFAADSNDSNNNTFFVVLVGNSAIELRASYIREFVRGLKQQPELVIPLLNEHRIDPVGFGSGAKGGRKIIKYISKMGRSVHIEAIRREEENLVEQWKEEDPTDYGLTLKLIKNLSVNERRDIQKVFEEFGILFNDPKDAEKYADLKVMRSTIRDRAAFSYWRLRNLRIPRSNIFVVQNIPQRGKIEMLNPDEIIG